MYPSHVNPTKCIRLGSLRDVKENASGTVVSLLEFVGHLRLGPARRWARFSASKQAITKYCATRRSVQVIVDTAETEVSEKFNAETNGQCVHRASMLLGY